jgi:hypothetical protein
VVELTAAAAADPRVELERLSAVAVARVPRVHGLRLGDDAVEAGVIGAFGRHGAAAVWTMGGIVGVYASAGAVERGGAEGAERSEVGLPLGTPTSSSALFPRSPLLPRSSPPDREQPAGTPAFPGASPAVLAARSQAAGGDAGVPRRCSRGPRRQIASSRRGRRRSQALLRRFWPPNREQPARTPAFPGAAPAVLAAESRAAGGDAGVPRPQAVSASACCRAQSLA